MTSKQSMTNLATPTKPSCHMKSSMVQDIDLVQVWTISRPLCMSKVAMAGSAGDTAARVLRTWERQKPLLPPANWRAPPPAGYLDAQGMRRIADEPWRPVRSPGMDAFSAGNISQHFAQDPIPGISSILPHIH